jgi:hypothetical protein
MKEDRVISAATSASYDQGICSGKQTLIKKIKEKY